MRINNFSVPENKALDAANRIIMGCDGSLLQNIQFTLRALIELTATTENRIKRDYAMKNMIRQNIFV